MDNVYRKIFNDISGKAGTLNEGIHTFVGDDGLRRCKACGKKLETILHFNSPALKDLDGMKVNCICDCGTAKRDKINHELKAIERDKEKGRHRAECFKIISMADMTFAKDDSSGSEPSNLSRRWVSHYEKNLQSGKPIPWLFFYGSTGTGKTFYAACIANAMIEKGYLIKLATGSEIEQDVFNADDKASIYKRYAGYDVLILDDLAAERKSDYMYEILYNIINDRYLAQKPMIITTNMTTAETGNPKDKRLERIMSRIYAYGYPIEVKGKDRRKEGGNWK